MNSRQMRLKGSILKTIVNLAVCLSAWITRNNSKIPTPRIAVLDALPLARSRQRAYTSRVCDVSGRVGSHASLPSAMKDGGQERRENKRWARPPHMQGGRGN